MHTDSLLCVFSERPRTPVSLQGQRPPAALAHLEARLRKRESTLEAATQFSRLGNIAYAELPDSVDSELFPAVLADATVILIASPRPQGPGRWDMKVRLGRAAPEGLILKP